MAKGLDIKRISGMNDVLPDELAPFYANSANWMKVFKAFMKMASDYGFEYMETPEVEKVELFKRTVGKSSDIVRKEMYVWDQGDETLALRPEGSASVCRAIAESGLNKRKSQLKVWYKGGMFRRERPQLGRYRRHTQLGLEFFGVESAFADAEVISFAYKFYKLCGLKDIEVHVNSIGCPTCRAAYKAKLLELVSPKIGEYCDDCKERININPLRILDCKNEHCIELNKNLPSIIDYLCDDCKAHFEELLKLLGEMDVEFVVDPCLVRGLDYYSRTAFEVLLKEAVGPIKTLSGGGRYDGLMELLSGEKYPAVGFGIGIERLLLAMERQGGIEGDSSIDYFVAYVGDKARVEAFKLTTLLRDKGYSAMLDYKGAKLKKQFSQASSSMAKKTLILGDDELERGIIAVKDMSNGEQTEVNLDDFIAKLAK